MTYTHLIERANVGMRHKVSFLEETPMNSNMLETSEEILDSSILCKRFRWCSVLHSINEEEQAARGDYSAKYPTSYGCIQCNFIEWLASISWLNLNVISYP